MTHIPEGWRLVPVEPTREMLSQGETAIENQNDAVQGSGQNASYTILHGMEAAHDAYKAMLAAAPPAPALGQDAMWKALEFYANAGRYDYDNDCVWDPPTKKLAKELGQGVLEDGGEIARAALATDADNPTAHHKTGGE